MKSCLIQYDTKSDLTKIDHRVLTEQFLRALQGRVEKAYFFGSFATGQVTNSSDIDLILVVDTKKPFLERGADFLDLYEIHPNLDVLIYTASELNKLLSEDFGFWASVKDTLKPLVPI